MDNYFYVYIISSRSSTLYTGFTSDLMKRILEHKEKLVEGFTKRYAIDRLLYYESCENRESALTREKQIKGWTRDKKIALIESVNPEWKDLSLELMDYTSEIGNSNKPIIKKGIKILPIRQGDSSQQSECQ